MPKNNLEIVASNDDLKNRIYTIRGQKVMLDTDLALLYQVETKRVNESVRRNKEKFPERFSWVLDYEEVKNLRSHFATANMNNKSRVLNRVFTEQGIYMLATVLRSKVATETTLRIMDAFILMKNYISTNLLEQKYYNDMTIRHDSEIRLLQESFSKLEEDREMNEIYFNGKIYDAYSKIIDIFKEAKKELIIVDRYTDKTILDMVKNLNCKVILITGTNTKISKTDIEKYNKTYNNLEVFHNNTYHDRYFIIDENKIYHSGNSVNHIGYRKSSINILEDENVKRAIIEDARKIIF